MRRLLIVLVIVSAGGLAGGYVYFFQPFGSETELTSVLTDDTVAFVRLCDLEKQVERFQAGPMGRSLAEIDLDVLLQVLDATPREQDRIKRWLSAVKNGLNSVWFDILFGQDVILAVQALPHNMAAGDMPGTHMLLNSLVVVSHPGQPTRVLESLTNLFGSDIDVKTYTYKQWEMQQIVLEHGLKAHVALDKGLMIAGFSAVPVQRCLEQILAPQTSFVSSHIYRRNGAGLYHAGRTDMTAFFDGAYLLNTTSGWIDERAKVHPDMAALKNQLEKLKGIRDINLAVYDDGGPLVQTKMIIGLDRDVMSADLARALSLEPGRNPTLTRAPAAVLFYNWQNTFDLSLFWQSLKDNPRITPDKIIEIQDSFAETTGTTLETFLESLGSQAGLLINEINMNGILPLPEVALYLEVKKPVVIQEVIRSQIERMGLSFQKETYKDAVLYHLMLPAGPHMSPAYTVRDGFFTLAVNRALLKAMLDADVQNSLSATPDFKTVDKGLSAENNQVFFLRPAELAARTRDLAAIALTWSTMVRPQKTEEYRRIAQGVIYPVLGGLSMVRTLAGRTYTEKTRINSEIFTLLDRN